GLVGPERETCIEKEAASLRADRPHVGLLTRHRAAVAHAHAEIARLPLQRLVEAARIVATPDDIEQRTAAAQCVAFAVLRADLDGRCGAKRRGVDRPARQQRFEVLRSGPVFDCIQADRMRHSERGLALEHFNVHASLREHDCGRQAGYAAADDSHRPLLHVREWFSVVSGSWYLTLSVAMTRHAERSR